MQKTKLLTVFLLTSLVIMFSAPLMVQAINYYSVTFAETTGGYIFWKYGTSTDFIQPNPDPIYGAGTYAVAAGDIMIDAAPLNGYVFDHFAFTAGSQSGNLYTNPYHVVVTGGFHITAYFRAVASSFTATFASSTGGYITWNLNGVEYNEGTVTLPEGSNIIVSAHPEVDYSFSNFTIQTTETETSTTNPYTFSLAMNTVVTGNFEASPTENLATVVLADTDGGMATVFYDNGLGPGTGHYPAGTYSFQKGANLTFEAYPDFGSVNTFSGWTVTGLGTVPTNNFTIYLDQDFLAATANFVVVATPTPTATDSENGGTNGLFNGVNLPVFYADMTAIVELVIGAVLVFGGVLIFMKASKAWVVGIFLILPGFFVQIIAEPNIWGIIAFCLELAGYTIMLYGVRRGR